MEARGWPEVIEVNPLDLNEVMLTDALVYAVATDTANQRVRIPVEIDQKFHAGFAALGKCLGDEECLIDLICEGVTAVSVSGLVPRPSEWRANEKPHNWEISRLTVTKRAQCFELRIDCFQHQRIRVVFDTMSLATSETSPGIRHDYETGTEAKPSVEKG